MKSKGIKWVVIACMVVIIGLLGVICVLLLREPASVIEEEKTKRNVVVTTDNVEEVIEEMVQSGAEFVEPGYYTVNMELEWHFATGDAVSDNARVDNMLGNTNAVYFDVFLKGNEDEPIYESPIIPIGAYLDNIALDKKLEKGTHDCVCVYHLVDEEQNSISTLRIAFKIVVDA